LARLNALIDPVVMARVPATTALRVLEKNAPIAMVFPVTDKHVHSVENVLLPGVENVLHTVTAPHAQTVLIDLAMQIVRLEVTARHTVIVQIGENVLAMVIVMVRLVVSVLLMVIVMVLLVVIVPTVQQVIVPPMGTEVTAMHAQNVVNLVAVVPAAHLEVSVQAETGVASHLSGIVMNARIVQNVLRTVTALSVVSVLLMAIVMVLLVVSVLHMVTVVPVRNDRSVLHMVTVIPVRNDRSVLRMVTVVPVPIAGVIVPPIVIVPNDLGLANAVVDQIVLVLRALAVVMKALLAGKSQNSQKNSEWLANFVWFALTMMILGSMKMSPVMSWTKLRVMNSRHLPKRTLNV
jgi:hypothetical protein